MRLLVERRGQPQFRAALMSAYDGRCAISGCPVEQALEAAHIVGYRGVRTNHVSNGLLLRADLHTLFDAGLMTIDSKRLSVIVGAELAGTEYDSRFAGRRIRVPRAAALRPDRRALEIHRKGCGL
ncbi:MAG: HNH endonuclease [Myxococcales bacterium]|nr:HNH endonuclease [Myxococcales bacterium]